MFSAKTRHGFIEGTMESNSAGRFTLDLESRDEEHIPVLLTSNDSTNTGDTYSNSNRARDKMQEAVDVQASNKKHATAVDFPHSVIHLEEIELVDFGSTKESDRSIQPVVQIESSPSSSEKLQTASNIQPLLSIEDIDCSKNSLTEDQKQAKEAESQLFFELKDITSTQSPGNRREYIPHEHSPTFSAPDGAIRSRDSTTLSEQSSRAEVVDDDDDEDISMENLLELLGAVRQYAKEIHEIYAPIKTEEEERIRMRNEKRTKRTNKEANTGLAEKSEKQLASPFYQEVLAEIHSPEEQCGKNIHSQRSRHSKPDVFKHSKSQEPVIDRPLASLHVENEKLSSTWPRGNRKSPSRERFWSEMTLNKQKSCTPSSSRSFLRPHIPAEWSRSTSDVHDKAAVVKEAQKVYRSTVDPRAGKMSSPPQLKLNSSESVIEIERTHQETRPVDLPKINIILSPPEFIRVSVESSGGILPLEKLDCGRSAAVNSKTESKSYNEFTPIGSDQQANISSQSRTGRSGTRSSVKAGLRRRKSIDQGQQFMSLEKF